MYLRILLLCAGLIALCLLAVDPRRHAVALTAWRVLFWCAESGGAITNVLSNLVLVCTIRTKKGPTENNFWKRDETKQKRNITENVSENDLRKYIKHNSKEVNAEKDSR